MDASPDILSSRMMPFQYNFFIPEKLTSDRGHRPLVVELFPEVNAIKAINQGYISLICRMKEPVPLNQLSGSNASKKEVESKEFLNHKVHEEGGKIAK